MNTATRKHALISALLFTLAGTALAGPTCDVPKERWLKEADFKAMVEKQGYTVKTFKVSKGQCYEIYGFDKDGRKVEIYFDPATGKALEQK